MRTSRPCTFCGNIRPVVKISLLTDEQRAANQAWLDSLKKEFHTGHCPHLELPTYACEECIANHPEVTLIKNTRRAN